MSARPLTTDACDCLARIRQGFGNNAVHSDFSNARQPSANAEVEFH
ncbi:MAG: hypothetical protein QOE94_969 [Mycobacterium sp.]|jgi:hypothetical protein|nr:hypothetical protein [Mycobacterium sp.]